MHMHNESLEHLRHSAAHLLAAAVEELYPNAKRTIGPAIEDGFYYDFDFGTEKIGEEDLKKIEKKMGEIVKHWKEFEHREVRAEEAKEFFKDNQYKRELIEEFSGEGATLTFYTAGKFTDLCRGGHSENPSKELRNFKLLSIAGAYWRGNEKNTMLTRIYGTAFPTKEELVDYLKRREEAAKRDHRLLGEKLDLFYFDESIGKGLPIWLPNGNVIKEELEKWAKETEEAWGYQRITTPIITKENLFYTSGHLPLYKDSMYAPIVIEDENYYIKPMNCPFHHKTFAARPKSYRDLPVRFAEYGWCHRYEDSGSLFGLMRVRGMQMNDAHIYVSKEHAVEEFVQVIKLHEYYYKTLGITNYEMELALRDPNKSDKYHGDEADWKEAEEMTVAAMEKSGVPYKIVHEGAAFYGPKMDFQIYSSIGRAFTASTNQLDLYMGKKFGLEYIDKDGSRKTPAIIHRAPLGTHERFIGFLIEHFAGEFPVWLSPVQVAIVPVSEKHLEGAEALAVEFRKAGIRVSIDKADETVGKKIRKTSQSKVPYALVIGDKELEGGDLMVRVRGIEEQVTMTKQGFVEKIRKEIENRV